MEKTKETGLIDLSGIPLEELWKLGEPGDDTALDRAIRKVMEAEPDQSVSAFNSAP